MEQLRNVTKQVITLWRDREKSDNLQEKLKKVHPIYIG